MGVREHCRKGTRVHCVAEEEGVAECSLCGGRMTSGTLRMGHRVRGVG